MPDIHLPSSLPPSRPTQGHSHDAALTNGHPARPPPMAFLAHTHASQCVLMHPMSTLTPTLQASFSHTHPHPSSMPHAYHCPLLTPTVTLSPPPMHPSPHHPLHPPPILALTGQDQLKNWSLTGLDRSVQKTGFNQLQRFPKTLSECVFFFFGGDCAS